MRWNIHWDRTSVKRVMHKCLWTWFSALLDLFWAIGNVSSPQSGSLWVKIELCRPIEGELDPRGLWQLSWIMFWKFVNYTRLGGSSYSDECYIMSNVCNPCLSNDSSSHLICWTWLINLETSLGPVFLIGECNFSTRTENLWIHRLPLEGGIWCFCYMNITITMCGSHRSMYCGVCQSKKHPKNSCLWWYGQTTLLSSTMRTTWSSPERLFVSRQKAGVSSLVIILEWK